MGTSTVLTLPLEGSISFTFHGLPKQPPPGDQVLQHRSLWGHCTFNQNTARASEHSSLSSGAQVCLSLASAAWCFPWFTPYCIRMVYEVKLHWSDGCWSTLGRCGIQSMLASFLAHNSPDF